MVHGKNRIPYWIDWRLTCFAGPEYDFIILFGLPFEPEDCQYGKSRIEPSVVLTFEVKHEDFILHLTLCPHCRQCHNVKYKLTLPKLNATASSINRTE